MVKCVINKNFSVDILIDLFLEKGGKPEEMEGKMCLCNALFATAGLPQVRTLAGEKKPELPVVTFGKIVPLFAKEKGVPYSAKEVIDYLLGQT